MPYYSVNDHVKDCGLQGVHLSYLAVALEGGPVMDPCHCHHLEPDSVCLHNAERSGPHYIPCQYIKTEVPVQGILGLVQVEEYGMGDCLPHGDELLKHIFLESSGTCSSTRVKAMQSIMELDGR